MNLCFKVMLVMIKINQVRHLWPEEAGFELWRPNGTDDHVFLHFINSVEILSNGDKITAPPGGFILYSANSEQWFKSRAPLVHDWIHIDGDISMLLDRCNFEPNRIYNVSDSNFITDIVREIETEQFSQSAVSKQLQELKIQEMFLKIYRSLTEGHKFSTHDSGVAEKLSRVRETVFSSLQNSWRVADMAKLMYISESHFYSLYKEQYGVPPIRDLIAARVDKAKSMLESGLHLQTVMAACGYKDEFHFIRQFKSVAGITPKQYQLNVIKSAPVLKNIKQSKKML